MTNFVRMSFALRSWPHDRSGLRHRFRGWKGSAVVEVREFVGILRFAQNDSGG